MRKAGDWFLSLVVLFGFGFLLLAAGATLWLLCRCIPRPRSGQRKVLLCLVPSGFEEIAQKGVSSLISEREEDGFLTHVYSIYFPSERWGRLPWSPRQSIWKIPRVARRWRQWGFRDLFEILNGLTLLGTLLVIAPWVRRRIDLIRGQDPAIMGAAAFWLSFLTGIPYCVSIHADHKKRYHLDPKRGTVAFG